MGDPVQLELNLVGGAPIPDADMAYARERGREIKAVDVQMGGDHYKRMAAYQPWEVLQRWLSRDQYKGYLLGTALAYLARFNSEAEGKGGMLDVKKAAHTLQQMADFEDAISGMN